MTVTTEQVESYLSQIPNAHSSWVDILVAARVPEHALERLVQTMLGDPSSPLRMAEDTMLSREIVKFNMSFGVARSTELTAGKMTVQITSVLTAREQHRVVRLTERFCNLNFKTSRKYGHNGHVVMNAVRRATAAYVSSRVPAGSSVVELGPDVKFLLTERNSSNWGQAPGVKYGAARPVLGVRDAIRVQWSDVVTRLLEKGGASPGSCEVTKAMALKSGVGNPFQRTTIQNYVGTGEYVISNDANYDVGFDDMPRVMQHLGARAWYGSMVRAKGLTSRTRITEGTLELMGVNFRVDWKAGRIDFRHPQCAAFGYSHNVWEYMKYEERNGYAWETSDCTYVYSKGPETSDELLFFSVIRVPRTTFLQQPSYVEEPRAGMCCVESIWAVGDVVDGLPRKFEQVKFYVDKLAFSKIFEKRRALDYKGELGPTMALVRSTNVRMWLNGTPVGVGTRVAARLIEATAVAIESLATEARLMTNGVFSEAMKVHRVESKDRSWVRKLLEQWVDLRVVSGSVFGPVASLWASARAALLDAALRPLSSLVVRVSEVEAHLKLSDVSGRLLSGSAFRMSPSACKCRERADIVTARKVGYPHTREFDEHEAAIGAGGFCETCVGNFDKTVLAEPEPELAPQQKKAESESSLESITAVESEDEQVSKGSVGLSQGELGLVKTEHGGYSRVFRDKRSDVGWGSLEKAERVESLAMQECIKIEEYIQRATLVEARVESLRLVRSGALGSRDILEWSTNRTQHGFVKVEAGRVVDTIGVVPPEYSVVYDFDRDRVIKTRKFGTIMQVKTREAWYYVNNHMQVWNFEEIIAALRYALDYGVSGDLRSTYRATLGVPGAGKTYALMQMIAKRYHGSEEDRKRGTWLVLSVTVASKMAAIAYGRQFGIPERILMGRVKTLDSYLITGKFPTDFLGVDECPMAHAGRVDAAVSISGATEVHLWGDAEQIPYDAYCPELEVAFSKYGDTIPSERREFLPETHRLNVDVCAAWLDRYPRIYPCKCCRVGERTEPTMFYEPVGSVVDVKNVEGVRYHTYWREEADELRLALRFSGTADEVRRLEKGGLATVHQDQGSTHPEVHTVRLQADYDKNASKRNPSHFNKLNYVLTDQTRHTKRYVYSSVSTENDEVRKRIELSRDERRRALVMACEGLPGNENLQFNI